MIIDRAELNPPLENLRHRWRIAFFCTILTLICCHELLRVVWHPLDAGRWAIISSCTLTYILWLFRKGLKDNHRPENALVLPTLGLGNTITLVRGLVVGLLSGFLFSPWPPGWLAWVPGLLYAVFVVGDFFDGYASRKTNRTTELGKNLDMEYDSLGTLIAVMLAIQYAQLPIWFLSVGVARYLFVFGIRWRERTGKPVLELPFSFNRRIIGGFMAGFLSVALLPLFSRPATTIAGTIFALSVLASFVQDWLVVSRRVDPAKRPSQETQPAQGCILIDWILLGLRLSVAAVAAIGIISQELTVWVGFLAPYSGQGCFVAVAVVGIAAATMLTIGAAGRLAAFALLVVACLDTLDSGIHWFNSVILAGASALMLFGSGTWSIWRPEDAVLNRYPGDRKSRAKETPQAVPSLARQRQNRGQKRRFVESITSQHHPFGTQHGGHSYCAGHTDEVGHLLSQRPWLPRPRNRSVFAPLPALASLHPLDSYRLYHADRSPVDPKWRAFTHWLQRQADRDSVNESTVDRSSTV